MVDLSQETPPRVLGIDPGSNATGWGLLGGTADRPELLDCGLIRLRAGAFASKLELLHREIERLVDELQPTSAAVETLFHGRNARSALQLAHARGVILAALALGGVEIVEYTPATVKKTVTGNGQAEKDQVRRMVERQLGNTALPGGHDVSDALAAALCHLACGRRYGRTVRRGPGRNAPVRDLGR